MAGTQRLQILLVLLAVLPLPGCASLSFGSEPGFGPKVQAEQIRARRAVEAELAANPPKSEPLTADERIRRGDELRRQGDLAGAMWNYLRAHEADVEATEPLERIAGLHLHTGPRQAEELFRGLIEEHPESGPAHAGLGLALLAREQWAEARAMLEEALERSPRLAAAHSALGVCLDQLGEHAAAREAYLRATVLHPRYYEALNNLGVSYLATQEFEAAAATLRQAARQEDRDPAVFNNLGVALGRLGRYDDALEAFRRAGSEQAARNNLGYVLFLNGSYERAIEEYEEALLARGDERLALLRNLRAAQVALNEREAAAP